MPVPIIDLFAGPGGLGEGFASLQGHKRQPFFEIALSIEKDAVAHRTLTLRAVFRRLRGTKDVRHYYSYIRGEIDEAAFRRIPAVASAFEHAATEARCLELGKSSQHRQGNSFCTEPTELQQWLHDRTLDGVCQHEARAHMASDLTWECLGATTL